MKNGLGLRINNANTNKNIAIYIGENDDDKAENRIEDIIICGNGALSIWGEFSDKVTYIERISIKPKELPEGCTAYLLTGRNGADNLEFTSEKIVEITSLDYLSFPQRRLITSDSKLIYIDQSDNLVIENPAE